MKTLVSIFTSFSGLAQRLGVCGIVGVIAGSLAGTLLAIADLTQGGLTLTEQEAFYVALILTAFTWIAVLFILFFLVRLTFGSIALPTLLNCLITCFLLVFICLLLDAFTFAWLIGIVIGAIVGSLLCFVNSFLSKSGGNQL